MIERNADHGGVDVRNGAKAGSSSRLEGDVEPSAVLEVLGELIRDVQRGAVVTAQTPAHSDLS